MPDHEPIDLSAPQSIHVVGVGGAGMSAIAAVLAAMGHRVTGSDLRDSPAMDRLRAQGVAVEVGHDADHVADGVDAVVVSTAIPDSNPEVALARRRGIPVLRRAQVLAAVAATRRTVAVAGTHGKTTTSSMLALVLSEAGLRPSFIIGGDINEIGSGSAWDEGDLFVVEADESDGTFLEVPRFAAVVTNVEPDHLEHHGSWDVLRAAFEQFVSETPGPVVACVDDAEAAAIALDHGALTYGTAPQARYRMVDLVSGSDGASFTLLDDGVELGAVQLPVMGEHNARNAAAAVVTGLALGAPFDAAARAMARFAGVARRFEHRGEAGGVTFIDDYAHLPTEVEATLAAARSGGWRRVVCAFQPHRYSRTQALWGDFAHAFDDADLVVVTEVYPAGEAPRPGVSGKLVVQAMLEAHPWRRVAWLPHRRDVVDFLARELTEGDVCVTLGAGDLTLVPDEVIDRLSGASPGAT